MKRVLSLGLVLSIALTHSAIAQSPYLSHPSDGYQPKRSYGDNFPNWYLGLNGTMSFADDVNFNGSESETDLGAGGSVAIGYRPRATGTLLDNTRYELSLGYYTNDVENIAAQLNNMTLFFNTFYDFNAQGSFKPYIGFGLGASFGKFDLQERVQRGFLTDADGDGFTDSIAEGDPSLGTVDSAEYLLDEAGAPIPVFTTPGDDNDVALAYQLMAGFAYEFQSVKDVEFVMGYRFFDTFSNMGFDYDPVTYSRTTPGGLIDTGSFAGANASADMQSHNVDVGFRFRF